MAIVQLIEIPIVGDDRTTTNYDAMMDKLGVDGNKPEGLIVHTAGWDDEGGVFRILDVWESAEAWERFRADRLDPVLAEGPVNPDNAAPPSADRSYELHKMVS